MDLTTPGAASILVHVAARLMGLVAIAPIFSDRAVPVRLRTLLVFILAVLLQPVALRSAVGGRDLSPRTLAAELLIGFVIGFGAAVLVGAADVAGDFLSLQIGLSGAAILDPMSGHQVQALGRVLRYFVVAMMLAVGAHLTMLQALADSFRFLPIGAPLRWADGLAELASVGSILFSLGLQFAAPVIAVVMVANVALALLSRVAPQVQVLTLAFPVQIGLGLLILAASVPLMGTKLLSWDAQFDEIVSRVLFALAGTVGA